mgnify:CR=1 FL=1
MNQVKIFGQETVFGLDIGTRSIVGTIGYRQGERFVVVAQEIREHRTRAMLDGQIHDINRVAATISEIKAALEEKTGLDLTDVCIAAAGRVLKTMNVHVDKEFDTETSISKEDMSTLVSMGVEQAFTQFQKENDSDVHFYCVGYSVVKYYINGMWMGQPEHHKAKTLGVDMIATFLPDDVVDGLYSAVELAGLKVANMTLEPIAAIRVAIPERFRLLNIAMIDVGAGTSDISVTNDGSVIAFGMIPCAGDSLTEIIARKCLIDFATAERIKKEASVKAEIAYEDIMGLEQTITSEEVYAVCKPQIEKMAKQAADEIRRLNGDMSPSAVFVVGGGGKIKGFTEQIAKELELDPKRVALRGEEIMNDVDFPSDCLKDSTIITPVGICLSYYEQNNNFIYVIFNGTRIKLYDNNKLAVIDAAIQASFDRESLFPRRGKEVHYTVNGKNRVTRGEYGESATITVNGENVDINHAIKANDEIIMQESTQGRPAQVRISDLLDYHGKISVTVDGQELTLAKPIKVNGREETSDYLIQEGDEVSLYSYYTYGQMYDYLKLNSKQKLTVNGREANEESAIYAGDKLEIQVKEEKQTQMHDANEPEKEVKPETVQVFKDMVEQAAKEEKQEEETISDNKSIVVIANQKPVTLAGKDSYQFVDIFDYIDFDTRTVKGKGIVTRVNGENAQYTQQLKDGDKLEIFWK